MNISLYITVDLETGIKEDWKVEDEAREHERGRERVWKGGIMGLVTTHKPMLRTITVTNHIVFVVTSQHNAS